MSDLFSPFSVLRGARSADEVLRSRHVAGALFRRFARRNAALCPRRRSSTCAVARNGKHRSPTSDEVPQVKVENRKTAVPFARARVRVCQSVSVFCLHLFTHMPQNFDSQINRGEGFAKILHILLFPRGFFFDNPLFSNALSLITTKNGKFDQCLRLPEPLRGVLFSSKGSVGATTHNPFIQAGCEAHFCRSVLDSAWQTARISTAIWGEVAVAVFLHGRTRKREPQSTKPSHLSNYESTICTIRVKR